MNVTSRSAPYSPELEPQTPELLRRGRALHPRFSRPVRYTTYRRPVDDERATADTIGLMQRFIREDARAPAVRAAAYEAIAQLSTRDATKEIQGVFGWIKRHVRLIEDSELARPIAGIDADQAEVLIRPVDLLAMPEPAGDCDCQAMLAAAMLRALGIETALVTIAADPEDLSQYSHVYLFAFPPGGPALAVDVSHGPWAGWQARALGKARAWPALGQINWGSLIQTGVQTTADILKARLALPPAGTYIQTSPQGQVLYRQQPGTTLQFPTTQLGGEWTSIILLAVVGLVLILALRGRS